MSFISASCVDTRKTTYFNEAENERLKSPEETPPIIHKNDILDISVSSLNADASKIFNAPIQADRANVSGEVSTSKESGYLVNEEGSFNFPILGKVKAAGLTQQGLSEFLSQSLLAKKLLVDPIVTVRILNFHITVLGEVGHPSVINVPNERISILEALGFAGDITIYGKRDNVLLIREENGEKIVQRIDLSSKDIFTSPLYYLKSSDVIYVESDKNKIRSVSNGRQLLPVILSGLGFLTTVAFLIAYHN